MGRICMECDAEMRYDEQKHMWHCPRCEIYEEGEEPFDEEGNPRYRGFKQGGPRRSQKK